MLFRKIAGSLRAVFEAELNRLCKVQTMFLCSTFVVQLMLETCINLHRFVGKRQMGNILKRATINAVGGCI